MEEQQEILLGNAFVSDKGNWQQGVAYETNDIVHTQDGIFLSMVDNNTTQPSASAEGWKVLLDKATRVGLMNLPPSLSQQDKRRPLCGFET